LAYYPPSFFEDREIAVSVFPILGLGLIAGENHGAAKPRTRFRAG
jgi:hypothetical protein